jgi:hypothetical protein|tara:strand:- start:2413 stop:2664 length:252 start_codon:yes stop_codon:yes gene_type:complete
MIVRSEQVYAGKELISETFRDVTWNEVKLVREEVLEKSDWRFLSDQTPSQEWIDYRQFLRDLPQNYESANDAADAWNEYEIPE